MERLSMADIIESGTQSIQNAMRAEETYSTLLGLRVTSRIHPDVSGLVSNRTVAIVRDLDRSQLQLALLAAIESASIMYEERDPLVVRRQADNIARALRDAEDAGVIS